MKTFSYTDNITGVSIATLETYDFTHSDQLSFTAADTANITVSIENINSGTDIDGSNNSLSTEIYSLEFVAQRLPLYEHFTFDVLYSDVAFGAVPPTQP